MICEIKYTDREDWLAKRKNYIGGSDAGSVVGLNPYTSAYALWAEKTGKVPPFDGNITTRVGAYLEDLVAKMFEDETGKRVRRKNRMLVNDLYPFAVADIDRLIVGEDAILEIKTTSSFGNAKLIESGDYPAQWYCQMTHYLAVTGCKKAYLAVLINCRDFKIFELERNQDEIDALMNAERDFWELVKADKPPVADGSESTSKTIEDIYSGDDDDEETDIDLYDLEGDLRRLEELDEMKKNIEDQIAEEKNKIKAVLGDDTRGHSDNYTCTWRVQVRKTFDTKEFAKAFPTVDLSPFYKESSTRVFKYSKIK